jgi:hypothetical protein
MNAHGLLQFRVALRQSLATVKITPSLDVALRSAAYHLDRLFGSNMNPRAPTFGRAIQANEAKR